MLIQSSRTCREMVAVLLGNRVFIGMKVLVSLSKYRSASGSSIKRVTTRRDRLGFTQLRGAKEVH